MNLLLSVTMPQWQESGFLTRHDLKRCFRLLLQILSKLLGHEKVMDQTLICQKIFPVWANWGVKMVLELEVLARRRSGLPMTYRLCGCIVVCLTRIISSTVG